MALSKSTLENSIKTALEQNLKKKFKEGKLDKDELKKQMGDKIKESTKKANKITLEPGNFTPKTKEELLVKAQAQLLDEQNKLAQKEEDEYIKSSNKINEIINSNDDEILSENIKNGLSVGVIKIPSYPEFDNLNSDDKKKFIKNFTNDLKNKIKDVEKTLTKNQKTINDKKSNAINEIKDQNNANAIVENLIDYILPELAKIISEETAKAVASSIDTYIKSAQVISSCTAGGNVGTIT